MTTVPTLWDTYVDLVSYHVQEQLTKLLSKSLSSPFKILSLLLDL